mmetsp:Transcript_30109/g.29373  ORF Transcript_30109/g.29373 Transcript_30109/m.29373 type:complete len:93 (-) Transcript_30109:1506-1784(-)
MRSQHLVLIQMRKLLVLELLPLLQNLLPFEFAVGHVIDGHIGVVLELLHECLLLVRHLPLLLLPLQVLQLFLQRHLLPMLLQLSALLHVLFA